MRLGFGLIALLAALAIVAVLTKKQTGAMRMTTPPAAASTTDATVRAQSQQIQQQVREQVDALMQQPRSLPDDAQ
ncbi:MAG TPA: hypothetical protein DIC45_05560 [Comamonadaceae bacterium]|uniref:hypothetical protein n=1 Tax=Pulveribacter sp. TaxID=2678893 RepID=UPI000EBBDFF1|nr:hypothetical protein [Pulveribacter sp.]HCL85964.1 hypothetical protein [Comamonadaceae bacterium]